MDAKIMSPQELAEKAKKDREGRLEDQWRGFANTVQQAIQRAVEDGKDHCWLYEVELDESLKSAKPMAEFSKIYSAALKEDTGEDIDILGLIGIFKDQNPLYAVSIEKLNDNIRHVGVEKTAIRKFRLNKWPFIYTEEVPYSLFGKVQLDSLHDTWYRLATYHCGIKGWEPGNEVDNAFVKRVASEGIDLALFGVKISWGAFSYLKDDNDAHVTQGNFPIRLILKDLKNHVETLCETYKSVGEVEMAWACDQVDAQIHKLMTSSWANDLYCKDFTLRKVE